MRRRRLPPLAVGLLVTALPWSILAAAAGEDFDEARLRAGQIAYQEKRFVEAINQFRIAAFGFLDRLPLLSESLVRLSLAQAAAGKEADADETMTRFLEVERRFQVYAQANLEPETRADFRALLKRRLPAATLAAVPSLTESTEARRSGAPTPAAAPSKPPAGTLAPANTLKKPGDPSSAAATSHSGETLAESRRLISALKAADAERILTEALKADPGNRDLRLALLEAACLSRSYPKAVAQVPLVAPLTDTETLSMFYAAVALYETGRKDEARDYFERSKSKVSGQLADEYSKKILGQP